MGTVLLVAGYLGLLAWAWWGRSGRGDGTQTGWRDLRWWVTVLVVIQVALYVWF